MVNTFDFLSNKMYLEEKKILGQSLEECVVERRLGKYRKKLKTTTSYRYKQYNKNETQKFSNSAQFRIIPCNPAQFRTIPCNSAQFRAIPHNSAQFRTIPHNSAQFHTIPPNSVQLRAIPRYKISIGNPS